MNTSTNNANTVAPKAPFAVPGVPVPKPAAKAPSKAAAPTKGKKAVPVATGKAKPASKPAKKASKAPSKPAKATKAAKPGKAPAKRAAPAKKAAGGKLKVDRMGTAYKVPAKKAKPVNVGEYNVKTGPTQGRISGYHIDEERPTKHGVTKRSAGTIGGRLWSIFDRMAKGSPKDLLIAKVKESTLVEAFNENKVVIEFYYWRRFNGVRGRGKKQKVA